MNEHNVRVEPTVTHEVKVFRADGTVEGVHEEILGREKTEEILEKFRRAAPEMVAQAEENARRAKAARIAAAHEETYGETHGETHEEATKNG